MSLLSKFGHQVPKAFPCCFGCLRPSTQAWVLCAASSDVVDLTSPAASTVPRCFSGAPSSPLLAVKTWEKGKSCSTYDMSILSENELCCSLQKQLILGPAHFCPIPSAPWQVQNYRLPTSLCPQSNLVYGFGFLRGQGGWQWAVQGQFVAFLL